MCAKAQKIPDRSKPNPTQERKNKPRSPWSRYPPKEMEALVSGPEKKLVEFCRKLIVERKITTRTEFNRFAPKEVSRHIRRNPDFWEKVGLPKYHDEVKANGFAAWERHCEAALNGDLPVSRIPEKTLSAPGKKAAPEKIPAGNPEEKKSAQERSPESGEQEFLEPKEPKVANRPSGTPIPLFLFRKWRHADAEEKELIKKRLFKVAVSGSVSEVCAMLGLGAPIDLKDELKRPFFMFVAEWGREDLLKEIVGYMGDVDRRDSKGDTVLMACAECGHHKCLQMLLNFKGKNKPDVNARNKKKQTAMMLAAWEGNLEEVKLLCEAGANPRLRDESKRNAEGYAGLEGHSSVVRYLRSRK